MGASGNSMFEKEGRPLPSSMNVEVETDADEDSVDDKVVEVKATLIPIGDRKDDKDDGLVTVAPTHATSLPKTSTETAITTTTSTTTTTTTTSTTTTTTKRTTTSTTTRRP